MSQRIFKAYFCQTNKLLPSGYGIILPGGFHQSTLSPWLKTGKWLQTRAWQGDDSSSPWPLSRVLAHLFVSLGS